ncbi:MAG: hypothetical protein LH468_01800, partial [Nocardioides sp.]|nr:hypothetical protein [Nocardioides sp.]
MSSEEQSGRDPSPGAAPGAAHPSGRDRARTVGRGLHTGARATGRGLGSSAPGTRRGVGGVGPRAQPA